VTEASSNPLASSPSFAQNDWSARQSDMVRRGNLLINANWFDALDSERLTDFETVMTCTQGQQLPKLGMAKHRQRDRIALGNRAAYLKRYRPGLILRLARSLRLHAGPSEADDEWSALWQLADAGIGVPEPVLFGPADGTRASRASCIGLAELPDAQPLERWLPDNVCKLSADQRTELLSGLADFVGRFHATGLVHRDLYLSHIFIRWNRPAPPAQPGQPGQPPRFWLIDLARVFRPVRWRRTRWLVKDLAQLRYSLGNTIQPAEWAAMLTRYAAALGRPESEVLRLAGRVARKSAAIARHTIRRKRRLNPSP
jgi:hypothetical protein